ncbi:MAG: gamma carbonic anhydrase family protein [Desulfocucumaceae bacterium]
MGEEKMLFDYDGFSPDIGDQVFIAPGAKIVGKVKIGFQSSIWYNTIVRGDADRVIIGSSTNIQDNCTLHQDPGFPLIVGDRVSVGHNCILHGCEIEDDTLVGMGAVVLNGAKIGAKSVIGAGSLVVQGMEVPPGHLVMGLPARIIRPLTEEESVKYRAMADKYRRRSLFVQGSGPCPDR